jgi:hypothetical protein
MTTFGAAGRSGLPHCIPTPGPNAGSKVLSYGFGSGSQAGSFGVSLSAGA